jgi:hypothetical protein
MLGRTCSSPVDQNESRGLLSTAAISIPSIPPTSTIARRPINPDLTHFARPSAVQGTLEKAVASKGCAPRSNDNRRPCVLH